MPLLRCDVCGEPLKCDDVRKNKETGEEIWYVQPCWKCGDKQIISRHYDMDSLLSLEDDNQ